MSHAGSAEVWINILYLDQYRKTHNFGTDIPSYNGFLGGDFQKIVIWLVSADLTNVQTRFKIYQNSIKCIWFETKISKFLKSLKRLLWRHNLFYVNVTGDKSLRWLRKLKLLSHDFWKFFKFF